MIVSILRSSFISIGVACLLQYIFLKIESDAVFEFLKQNITNLQIGLLAINGATLGIVLTKVKDLIEHHGNPEVFNEVKTQMLLSIREQVALVVVSLILIAFMCAKAFPVHIDIFAYKVALLATFVYTLLILYDTAKSVFVILDY